MNTIDNQIPTLTEIRAKHKPVRSVHDVYLAEIGRMNSIQKFAYWITKKVGNGAFFFAIVVWTTIWLSWNTFAPKIYHFDPFPSFEMWAIIANLLQLCLIPLLMIGQSIQAKYDEIRAQLDYEVNKRAEHEVALILKHLELLQEKVAQITREHTK